MITVLADKNLYKIKSFIPEKVNLILYDPTKGLPDTLDEADALLIRTVTPVNSRTLPGPPEQLSFVGSGSAGTDHVDHAYLEEHEVEFAYAAGCNARSVSEFVATALLIWENKQNINLKDKKVGIIGIGNVGSTLNNLLTSLGMDTVCYDPPRHERDKEFKSADLDQLLNCDILTFHTPLEEEGSYPTYHWLDLDKLTTGNFNLVINTARGGVVDEKALLQAHDNGFVDDLIIDVWENEPLFNDLLAKRAFFRTPHIAGYSIQAKLKATKLIVDAMSKHFELPNVNDVHFSTVETFNPGSQTGNSDSIVGILEQVHPINDYDLMLQKLIGVRPEKKSELFRKARTEPDLRNEFSHIRLPDTHFRQFPLLDILGFKPENERE